MAQTKSDKGAVIERLSDEDIAEAMTKQDENDLTRTGRNLTEVRSETTVIDRKDMSAAKPAMGVSVVETELAGGTVMRTYQAVEPVKAEDE